MRRIRKKLLYYVPGIVVLTLGIVLMIQSGLGVSPYDALLVGLSKTIGLTIGSWEIIVGAIMVLFNAAAQRRSPELTGLVTAIVAGGCIDIWVLILSGWLYPETIIGQILFFSFGLVLSGIGIAVYLQANFAPAPPDRSMLVVTELTGFNVMISRAIIFGVLLILALIFHGPIGIGTILSTFLSGVLINFFTPYVGKIGKGKKLPQKKFTG